MLNFYSFLWFVVQFLELNTKAGFQRDKSLAWLPQNDWQKKGFQVGSVFLASYLGYFSWILNMGSPTCKLNRKLFFLPHLIIAIILWQCIRWSPVATGSPRLHHHMVDRSCWAICGKRPWFGKTNKPENLQTFLYWIHASIPCYPWRADQDPSDCPQLSGNVLGGEACNPCYKEQERRIWLLRKSCHHCL